MPIFEYNCRNCKHPFETVVLSAQEKIACPECQSKLVDKLVSVFSSRTSGQETAAAGACTPQTCGCH